MGTAVTATARALNWCRHIQPAVATSASISCPESEREWGRARIAALPLPDWGDRDSDGEVSGRSAPALSACTRSRAVQNVTEKENGRSK